MAEKGVSWKQHPNTCTDNALSMLRETHGFIALVKTIAPHGTSSHCIICQVLPVENTQDTLKIVLR
jgi:hypothetical protein